MLHTRKVNLLVLIEIRAELPRENNGINWLQKGTLAAIVTHCFHGCRYELLQKGELKEEDVGIVPDIYVRNQQLDQELKYIRSEMEKYKEAAL